MEWENVNSEDLVRIWLKDFSPEIVKNSVLDENIQYLEKQLLSLEILRTKAETESKTADTSRARAVARDTEKCVSGLIAGIKFAISFMIYGKEENLNADSLS